MSPSSPVPGPAADHRHCPGLPDVPDWLDEVEGDRALEWVAERNAETLACYEGSARFDQLRAEALEILDSSDRIPAVGQACGMLYNFWTDADHPRGLWRRTTWESYCAGAPGGDCATEWEVLLDLDALGEQEDTAWVWHGASVLRTGRLAGRRALVALSDGGSDTDITRELDLETLRFIPLEEGGFHRAPSKGSAVWADDDGQTVLMTGDWGPPTLTSSGYPRQVRRVRRGQDPAEAEVVLTIPRRSIGAYAWRDRRGRCWLAEHPDFYTEQTWLLPDEATGTPGPQAGPMLDSPVATAAQGAIRLPVPASAQVSTAWDQVLIWLRDPWEQAGTTHPSGALLATPIEDLTAGRPRLRRLFTPTPTAFLSDLSATEHHLVLTLLDDCVSALEVLTPPADGLGQWERTALDLSALDGLQRPGGQDEDPGGFPQDPARLRPGRPLVSVSAASVDELDDDRLWLTASSFTTPTTLAMGALTADGGLTGVTVLRRAPERYDASGIVATQHVAVSADGTRVPYLQVGRSPGSGARSGEPTPTLLYGYGGFEVPLGVSYMPVTGKAWLERGGTYVIASIRGGGEYGPAWHRAGLKSGRHRVYEDFAAVARSLVERGVTTAERLAVHGGSNGGLLVGNMLVGYPELVGAVVCEVPLLDMGRYTRLLAGASWQAEYGDPDDPAEWEFLRTFSPFHLLEAGRSYPPVLFVTSTRDDRVHPAHARTMAHRMAALGQDVTYFENSEGGHGRASTSSQRAFMAALIHEFLWRRLDPARPD